MDVRSSIYYISPSSITGRFPLEDFDYYNFFNNPIPIDVSARTPNTPRYTSTRRLCELHHRTCLRLLGALRSVIDLCELLALELLLVVAMEELVRPVLCNASVCSVLLMRVIERTGSSHSLTCCMALCSRCVLVLRVMKRLDMIYCMLYLFAVLLCSSYWGLTPSLWGCFHCGCGFQVCSWSVSEAVVAAPGLPPSRGRGRTVMQVVDEPRVLVNAEDVARPRVLLRSRARWSVAEVEYLNQHVDVLELFLARYQWMNPSILIGARDCSVAEGWLEHMFGLFDPIVLFRCELLESQVVDRVLLESFSFLDGVGREAAG
ncbi:hypothetical protein F511_34237 [Dorcoceras hygrometricum]|uniref:Uncharacterized protein n=1 Tax=Dorcoceras hygrometricum TaxID=472368 RepID=A0A2Z7CJ75_9LAMI|nr:hypothetical protein F511_34237 [Dorcoceras hygrometricum]